MANYWIKLYIEILDDPKITTLPDRLWRRCIETFLLAGKLDGFMKEGNLPETKQLAWALRITTDELELDLKQLETTGIIQKTVTGWRVINFQKRQAATPDAERKRQERERRHKEQYNGVTPPSRTVTQRAETESETETETEEGGVSTFQQLSTAFVNATRIPELTGGAPKWIEACKKLEAASVEPCDIESAVKELYGKNYSIVSISSIVNPAISCMSKRKGKNNGGSSLQEQGYTYVGSNNATQ